MKTFMVPVALWISESGSEGAWPEIIKIEAEDTHEALLKTREFIIKREREIEADQGPAVWHKDAVQYKIPEGIWVTDPTYGIPDEEGFIMGDPIELRLNQNP